MPGPLFALRTGITVQSNAGLVGEVVGRVDNWWHIKLPGATPNAAADAVPDCLIADVDPARPTRISFPLVPQMVAYYPSMTARLARSMR